MMVAVAVVASLAALGVQAAPQLRPLPRKASDPALQEPSAQEHYAWLRDYKEVPFEEFTLDAAPPILRFKDLDDATFQQLVRDGSPFVVDDCTRGFDEDAIDKFECKDFARRWPTGNMRAEYTPGQYHIYLKDPDWYSQIHPQRAHGEHMAKENKIAGPYIWHVKDEEPLKTKREVQQHWRTPYFLEPSLANRVEANESFEFWFSMAGGGTFTHADAYCESTISMQFRGKKRWRVQAFPRVKSFLNATSYGDSSIYDQRLHTPWTPESEFTVGPGQCLIFPTGYLHETFVDPVGNDEGCYTASTFQFNHPKQVNLYRSYLSSFSMSHYGMGEPCLEKISGYATLLGTFQEPQGKPDKGLIGKEAERVLGLLDGDKDGRVTNKEIYAFFCVGKKKRKALMQGGDFQYSWTRGLSSADREKLVEEAAQVYAEDALQYHDVDKDGSVTAAELAQSFLQWSVVRYRLREMRRLSQLADKPNKWLKSAIAVEKDMLASHYCADGAPCEAVDELVAHGKRLKEGGKRAIAGVAGKVKEMFETDGDEDGEDASSRPKTGRSSQCKTGSLGRQPGRA